MKILTFTSLYPSNTMPRHGIFVENRLRHLVETGGIESRVVAPIPWFPFSKLTKEEYRQFSQVPFHEVRHEISIEHPRYLHLPKVGMNLQPFSMALSAYPILKNIINEGYDFNIITAQI